MSLAHLRRLAGIGDPAAYRDVDEAIQPIGTVHSRKDGDWVKTADGWVRVKKKDKPAIIGSKTPPKVSRSKKTVATPTSTPTPAPLPTPAPTPAVVAKPSTPAPAVAPANETPAQAHTRRVEAAKKIAPAVTSAVKKLGDDFDAAVVDEKSGVIYASFRDWSIPKDPPSSGDYDYEDDDYSPEKEAYYQKASQVAANGRQMLKTALASHMDAVQSLSVAHGDKNWFEVAIKLK